MNFLIDINGVLCVGNKVVEGAIETINFLKKENHNFRLVSNATRDSHQVLLKKLLDFGFLVEENEIITAPIAASHYIKKSSRNRCFLLTTEDIKRDFVKNVITEKNPSYVVVGDAGKRFTYQNLNKAFNYLLEGADLVALEKDRYWKSSKGLVMSAGPFVKALEYASGKESILIGKPSPAFFQQSLEDMGAQPENTIMIGDDPQTDIKGAQRYGMESILVKTGKYHPGILDNTGVKPNYMLESLAGLRRWLESN